MPSQEETRSNWDPNSFNTYTESQYNYDDAALLAQLWDIPVLEAKETIGDKITGQIERLLPEEVQALHAQHLKESADHEPNPVDAIEERQAIFIKGTRYTLQARALLADGSPANELSVSVYDKDTIFKDDCLGHTTTAENGGFELSFDQKDFNELFFDYKPDLYFILSNRTDGDILNTKTTVIMKADEATTPITLQL